MSRSIFEIDAELDGIATAFDQLEEGGSEEDVLEAVMNYFGDLVDERDAKLDKYALFMANRKGLAQIRKAEADRLARLAKTDENAADKCKGYLQMLFKAKGITKLETNLHKFWIQNNGGKAPLKIQDGLEPSDVPAIYQRVSVLFDNDAIRADIEGGIELPWARIEEPGQHLRVK